jgi:hypothetical protein
MTGGPPALAEPACRLVVASPFSTSQPCDSYQVGPFQQKGPASEFADSYELQAGQRVKPCRLGNSKREVKAKRGSGSTLRR